jgi:hypothetical protein
MIRALIAFVFTISVLTSCTQRTICPAYQSAFIYDKKKSIETFSYYNDDTVQSKEITLSNGKKIVLPARNKAIQYGTNPTYADKVRHDKSDSSDRLKYPEVYASASADQQRLMNQPYRSNYQVLPGPSLPKERYVKYDRYLLLPRKTYKKALRALNTVEMKKVYPEKPKPDSSTVLGAEMDSATVSPKVKKVDSTYMITLAREKYNVEQENYLWYLRKDIILPDAWYAKYGKSGSAEDKSKGADPGGVKGEKKKKGGFFKNLFKKKSKDTTSVAAVVPQQPDSVQNKPTKKSGFNPFKKKEKAPKPKKEEPKPKPVRKAEEDDGF